ncbi:MAG: LamG domain-containing protein, partial [Kiritimatiellae bacterium]|nr:LamG domain-containing protein [Kiritimatiellia bacterium]
ATVMPKRPGAKDVHAFGLWANYAMNRDDNAILEDGYRFAFSADKGYAADLTPVLNGYLYGKPEFVTDGEHQGFRFDGKTQYAELCPRAVDLGEITVDITFKPEAKGGYAVFDFGCSEDDCLVLSIARNGTPTLTATVGGKNALKLAGKQALAAGEWHNLRVELDGKKAVLWVDGRKAGEKSTKVRACDVFPGGGVKRNTIAAARDGKSGFKGILDHVLIYHTVHEDYSALPEPTLDAPVRPTPDYIAALAKKYGNLKALNAKAGALSKELLAPYVAMEARSKGRQQEIMERSPEYVKAVADLAAAEKAVAGKKSELTKAFDQLPANAKLQGEINDARAKNDALRNKINALERKAFASDEPLVALKKQRDEAETTRRSVEQELRKEFDKQPQSIETLAEIDAQRKQANDMRSEVQKLEKDMIEGDAALQELYVKRDKHEADRREREKALRTEFDARTDAAELAARADDARKRRHNGELAKVERDKAARKEDALRHERNDLWQECVRGDSTYTGLERARNEANRPIHEREKWVREGVRKNSEVARNYDELNNTVRELDGQLRRTFDQQRNRNERYAVAQAKRAESEEASRNRQEDLRADLRTSAPIYREQKKAEQGFRNVEQELRGKRDMVVGKGTADHARKVGESKGAVVEAEKVAWKAYGPERGWLYSFNNQGYRGYYNTAYNHYIGGHAKAIVGGGEMREDTNFLEALAKAVSGDDTAWRTSVDWDWRVRAEVDGGIADMPLTRNWLETMRGPVLKEKP